MTAAGDNPAGRSIRLSAPAKLNLNLLVGPVRDDDFHPLDSLVATMSLRDRIELSSRGDDQFVLQCKGYDCGPAAENLALRAAMALGRHVGKAGVTVDLSKQIPPGMGLGGGSSDAAAVLRGLCDLWRLDATGADVLDLAAQLGSDVPLFLGPPTLRMTGRGECLEPIAIHPFAAVLILPPFGCKTAAVYAAYDESPHPIAPQLDAGVIESQPPSVWRESLVNDLATPARSVCPPLAALQDRLSAAVSAPIHITGSGSGLFILCDTAAEAGVCRNAACGALTPEDDVRVVVVEPATG